MEEGRVETTRRLDIGCGNTVTEGYERADVNPNIADLDFTCELDAVPVDDATFAEVRAWHVIEHVPLSRVRRTVMKEWHRILAPGGVLRVDTPNIDYNVRCYVDGSWPRLYDRLKPGEQALCQLNGEPNAALWLNFKVFSWDDHGNAWNLHHWNATPDLLTALFAEAGFVDVRVVQTEPSVIVEGRRAFEGAVV